MHMLSSISSFMWILLREQAAHYLVMTQFDERTRAEPIPDVAGAARPRSAGGWADRGSPGPRPAKRPRLDPRARLRAALTALLIEPCSRVACND